MENNSMIGKTRIALEWIKAESGNTYICSVDALKGINSPTEDDLRRLCVEESNNPQND